MPLERRISIATCWASSRITLLDSIERYEDSYALTQEFREWIINLEDQNYDLNSSVLKVPESFHATKDRIQESDELLEL
ncbi:hypothetical protein [Prochlorococcus sp. MIT 0603]